MLIGHGVNEFAPMGAKRVERAGFIRAHQAGIADDVGGDDGRQSAPWGFGHRPSVAKPPEWETADAGIAVRGVAGLYWPQPITGRTA